MPATLKLVVPPSDGARERILAAASALFCRHGITATGVDAIIERAATAKATFYKQFGSKERLVEAVLERHGETWRSWFFARLDTLDLPPREKLGAVFDIFGEWFSRPDFVGCPFINAVGEYDKGDDRPRAMALRHKSAIDERLIGLARDAGARDAEALVSDMGLLIDGAIIVAMISRQPDVAARTKAVFQVLAERHWSD